MTILLVNTLYPPQGVGGAERSVALLARALVAAGEKVHVATLDPGGIERVTEEDGVLVHRLPHDNVYWPWGPVRQGVAARLQWHVRNRWNRVAALRVGRVIDRVEPQIVHTQLLSGFSPAVWPVVAARGLPLVHTLRDYSLICARAGLFRRGQSCARPCVECRVLTAPSRKASRMVDALIGNSDFLIGAHRRAGRFAGVESRRLFNIVPLPIGSRQIAQKEPIQFGFLGRIEPEKGIETLLAALALVGREDWSLRIGGAGAEAYLRTLRSRSSDDRIAWLGKVEASSFYHSIDVLVVPSLWPEPLPRTLVEATAHGCRVIAADSGGIPEVAGIGRGAALYPATDAAALAALLRVAIDRPDEWRGGEADPADLEAFSATSAVAAHRAVYAQLLERRAR